MTDDTLRELLHFRLEQAHESLREADVLCAAQANRGAVNRAYYAMFYALLALLATKQLGTSKHSGAISLFDESSSKPVFFHVSCPGHFTWPLTSAKPTIMVRWSKSSQMPATTQLPVHAPSLRQLSNTCESKDYCNLAAFGADT